MLVLTKDKGSGDSMLNCSAGRRKTYLNCSFVTLSILPIGMHLLISSSFCLQHSDLHLKSLWYDPMEMYTKGIHQNRRLKYFPQFNQ